MKFKASRLSDGNNVFPDEISIDDNSVTIKSPKLFGGVSKSFPVGQITVSINTPLIGFSDITLFSQGARMSVHGFSSGEAKKIRTLIENGFSNKGNKEKAKISTPEPPIEVEEDFNWDDDADEEEKVQEDDKKRFVRKVFENGIYEGGWKHEKRKGEGTMTYHDGNIYKGEWKHDLKHGTGKMIFANGDVYEGEWIDGDRSNGYGKYIWASGGNYEGKWIGGNFQGVGKMVYENGDVYDGEWVDDNREGTGTMAFQNGNFYKGEWVKDKMDGMGTMTYQNGEVYKGEWAKSEREGTGTMTYFNGDIYKGEWVGGEKEGTGTMTYANGDIYKGDWLIDDRHGLGTMSYENGDVYKGEWIYDEQGTGNFKECDPNIRDQMFEEAARLIVLHQQGSTSLIQRKMKLRYNRASRIIDQLEAAGIVSPFVAGKARDVLYQDEYSLERHLENLRKMD
jgi:hypothetical protein